MSVILIYPSHPQISHISNDSAFRVNLNLEVGDAAGINSSDARIITKAVPLIESI